MRLYKYVSEVSRSIKLSPCTFEQFIKQHDSRTINVDLLLANSQSTNLRNI